MEKLVYLDTGDICEVGEDGDMFGAVVAVLQHGVLDDDAHALGTVMAAAPELLEALQAMWDSSCTNSTSTPSRAAFLKAHAAIAKATPTPAQED